MSLGRCRQVIASFSHITFPASRSHVVLSPNICASHHTSTLSNQPRRDYSTDPREVLDTVAVNIENPDASNFAVIHVKGKQFKVSVDDVIQSDHLDLDTGTEITLDKVLLAGSLNYTLIGRPVLPSTTVQVKAVVIERGRGPYLRVYNSGKAAVRTHFWGKTWHKVNFHESMTTMLRITSIDISNTDLKRTDGG